MSERRHSRARPVWGGLGLVAATIGGTIAVLVLLVLISTGWD